MPNRKESYEGRDALVVFPETRYTLEGGGMAGAHSFYLDNPLNVGQFGKLCAMATTGVFENQPDFKVPTRAQLEAALARIDTRERPSITDKMAVILGKVSEAVEMVLREDVDPKCQVIYLKAAKPSRVRKKKG